MFSKIILKGKLNLLRSKNILFVQVYKNKQLNTILFNIFHPYPLHHLFNTLFNYHVLIYISKICYSFGNIYSFCCIYYKCIDSN